MSLKPLADFPIADRKLVRVLLSDIDDTMTSEGMLPAKSLQAMEAVRDAGILFIPVTGRPAGWCDHIARMWPVDAVVGENGAFYFAYDRAARKMRSVFAKGEEERRLDRDRLETLRAKILAAVPGVGIASDQDYRVADLAVDYCEDVAPLDEAAVARIVDMFVAAGATAKVSSIHVNGWFGTYDKLTIAERCLREVAGIDMTADNERIVFAGDSPNDAPMFDFFRHSVGVANVRRFELPHQPSWITQGESADGFCQLANALVEAQR